jgi:ATP-binding cassette subfamily B protein
MGRLLAYMRRYRGRYVLGVVCLLATASLAMSVPLLLKYAIDAIGADAGIRPVAGYAIAIIVIAIVQGVVRTWSRALVFNAGRDIETDLRSDLFAQLERLDQGFYQHQRTGDLMSRVINDVNAVRMMLGPGVLNLVNTPLYYVYGVGIMLTLDAPLTLAALLPYPVILWIVKRFSRRIMEHTLRVQEGLAQMSSHVQENLSGLHVVRAYAAEGEQAEAFGTLNERFRRQSLDLARVRGQLVPVMRTASGLGTLVVLWFGGTRVISGHLSVGDLVAFLGYLNLLAWPTMAMGWMISVLQRGRAAMMRLEHILDREPQIRDAPDAAPLDAVRGRVEFDAVDFRFPGAADGEPVLRGISFVLEPGQKLALVGRTGSGKSTIAALLTRLFDVSGGSIRLDGRDIRTLPLADLRRAVAVVAQDPFLFSTTLAENIRFASPDATAEEVRAAAEAAGIAADIDTFPAGYQTQVGERGVTLSGGQKQRTTLARAILADPRVLVLDDALSSVDARTERQILGSLERVLAGRTSIVITHRISTIQDADRIAVVDDGRIVELGDHSDLLARDGVYAELFRQQRLEEELAAL